MYRISSSQTPCKASILHCVQSSSMQILRRLRQTGVYGANAMPELDHIPHHKQISHQMKSFSLRIVFANGGFWKLKEYLSSYRRSSTLLDLVRLVRDVEILSWVCKNSLAMHLRRGHHDGRHGPQAEGVNLTIRLNSPGAPYFDVAAGREGSGDQIPGTRVAMAADCTWVALSASAARAEWRNTQIETHI